MWVFVSVSVWYACVRVLQLSPGIQGPCLPRYNKHSVSLCPACLCTTQRHAGECRTWAALALLIYRFKWVVHPLGRVTHTFTRWMGEHIFRRHSPCNPTMIFLFVCSVSSVFEILLDSILLKICSAMSTFKFIQGQKSGTKGVTSPSDSGAARLPTCRWFCGFAMESFKKSFEGEIEELLAKFSCHVTSCKEWGFLRIPLISFVEKHPACPTNWSLYSMWPLA